MEHTPELIKEAIKSLDTWSIETLAHNYKCALSKQLASERKLYKPFVQAIEKELKSRNRKEVASVTEIPETVEGSASDMYE